MSSIVSNQYIYSESVKFKDSLGREDRIKGIDVTAPPSLPKHFSVYTGHRCDVIVGSSSDESEDELDTARVGDSGDIGDGGGSS